MSNKKAYKSKKISKASASNRKAHKGLKTVGLLLMIFSAIDVAVVAIGFFYPAALGLDTSAYDAQVSASGGLSGNALITIALAFVLAVALFEFYFGLIAYRGHATKMAALMCLVIGVIAFANVGGSLFSGTVIWYTAVVAMISSLLSLMYYFLYKQLHS